MKIDLPGMPAPGDLRWPRSMATARRQCEGC